MRMCRPDRAYFETRLTYDVRRADVWRHVTRYVSRFVPPGAAVLELGAGYCHFINDVPARRRVAVDVAPDVLRWKGDDVEAHVADAVTFARGAADAEFDFVLASNLLEHLEWPALEILIAELHRVVRPGGRIALIQPNFRLQPRRYFDDYTHRTIFTDVSLADWLTASGFVVMHNEPRFLPLTVKSRLGALSFLVPLYLAMPFRPFAGQMLVVCERPARA